MEKPTFEIKGSTPKERAQDEKLMIELATLDDEEGGKLEEDTKAYADTLRALTTVKIPKKSKAKSAKMKADRAAEAAEIARGAEKEKQEEKRNKDDIARLENYGPPTSPTTTAPKQKTASKKTPKTPPASLPPIASK